MSYILEALRRADAERDRGAVPGLHAQPALGGAPASARRDAAAAPWGWIVAGGLAVVILAAGAGWAWLGGGRAPAEPVAAAGGSAAAAMVASRDTAPLVAVPVVPAAVAPPAPPVAPVARAAAPPIDPLAAADLPPPRTFPLSRSAARGAATNVDRPRAAPTVSGGADVTIGAAAPTPTAPAAPAVAAAAPTRPVALAELPEDVRRRLPAFAVGGSSWSPTAANRILIVNGQVLHEGDAVAPGLRLVQIRLRGATLSFEGRTFEIAY